MVRPLRHPVADGWYHVFGRGIGNTSWDCNRGCALFLCGVRQCCGLTLREAGQQAGGIHFSTVSTAVRRLEKQAAGNPGLHAMQACLIKLANDEP
jgi:hypothetical protein